MDQLIAGVTNEEVEQVVALMTAKNRLQNLIEATSTPDPEIVAEFERLQAACEVWKQILKMREEEARPLRHIIWAEKFPEENRSRAIELAGEFRAELEAARNKTMFGKSKSPDLMKMPAKEFVELFNLQKEQLRVDLERIDSKYARLFGELESPPPFDGEGAQS